MSKRKPTGKRTRFEVLKRDKFTCQYCGRKAPDVLLQVDHINPVANGGLTDVLNLVTACFDCNAGKSSKPLSDDSAIAKQMAQLESLQARREQLDMLVKWKSELLKLDDAATDAACEHLAKCYAGYSVSPSGRPQIAASIKKHGAAVVLDAIQSSAQYLKRDDSGRVTPESVSTAWAMVFKIADMAKAHEEKPYLRDLFYARACARNHCGYFNDRLALQLLERAHLAGAALEDLKRMSKHCRNWTAWSGELQSWIVELEGPK